MSQETKQETKQDTKVATPIWVPNERACLEFVVKSVLPHIKRKAARNRLLESAQEALDENADPATASMTLMIDWLDDVVHGKDLKAWQETTQAMMGVALLKSPSISKTFMARARQVADELLRKDKIPSNDIVEKAHESFQLVCRGQMATIEAIREGGAGAPP